MGIKGRWGLYKAKKERKNKVLRKEKKKDN